MVVASPADADIRQASVTDVAAIQRVARRSLSESCRFLGEPVRERLVEEWYADAAVRAAIERPDVTYVVAAAQTDDGEALVGYATGVQTGKTDGAVPSLAVDPDRWGEGIGTALVERLITTLHRRGIRRVEVNVLADNEPGVGFCETHGFDRVDEREADLPAGADVHSEYVYASDVSDGAKP